ncbi:MAG TPA: 16S rRNA (guanine(966)-N(2))-methyltransferase RsmD [Dehalococcoidia bacterium]|nr:16S rRNA (guanine(966)-N(2))-methyltransferase RsmD [Dehalococcoidia bacterium]
MPLRVIGGELGGRNLKGPPRSGVRPTTDRVREALFEILGTRVEGARVLDLYSGTGAVGIEALSRGAEHCDFVEADSKACEVVRENLTRTALLDRGRLYPLTVARAMARLQGPYELVVADPPYEYDRAESELSEVISRGLLAEDGTLVVEHSQRHVWPQSLAGRAQLTSRRYGDTRLTLYR